MPDVDLDAIREGARLHAERKPTWGEVEHLFARLDKVVQERDELRDAAQAIVNQARVGRRRVVWITPEPFCELAAALEDRDAE